MENWDTLEDFFRMLNDNCQYVVLRNYEGFSDIGFLADHPDIDILCSNRNSVMSIGQLSPRGKKHDKTHFSVTINGKNVSVDLRQVGDGYYCTKWENNMLAHRVMHDGLCYVLCEEDYHYSLIYHVVIQKEVIAEDYKKKLGIYKNNQDNITKELESFMRNNGYICSYPENVYTQFHHERINSLLVEKNVIKKLKRNTYYFALKLFNSFKNIKGGK